MEIIGQFCERTAPVSLLLSLCIREFIPSNIKITIGGVGGTSTYQVPIGVEPVEVVLCPQDVLRIFCVRRILKH